MSECTLYILRGLMPLINGVKFCSQFIYNLKGINLLQLIYLKYIIFYILIHDCNYTDADGGV